MVTHTHTHTHTSIRSYGNHTNRKGLVYIDKHTQPDSGDGAWCLDALMADNYGSYTAVNTFQQITALYQTGDSMVVVYDFAAGYSYIAFPSVWDLVNPVVCAYDRPFTRVDMKGLFAVAAP